MVIAPRRLYLSCLAGGVLVTIASLLLLARHTPPMPLTTKQRIGLPLDPGFAASGSAQIMVPVPFAAAPAEFAMLEAPGLRIPVAGLEAKQLRDTFTESRSGGRRHDAIDILAAEGTLVNAATNGRVAKLFRSPRGGLTVYQFDADERYVYYYAHLQRYAPGLRQGQALKQGETLGYVGHTGNASATAPHLHFAIAKLTAEKNWWQGEPLNPYPLLVDGSAPR